MQKEIENYRFHKTVDNGLSNLVYNATNIKMKQLYTRIEVSIDGMFTPYRQTQPNLRTFKPFNLSLKCFQNQTNTSNKLSKFYKISNIFLFQNPTYRIRGNQQFTTKRSQAYATIPQAYTRAVIYL